MPPPPSPSPVRGRGGTVLAPPPPRRGRGLGVGLHAQLDRAVVGELGGVREQVEQGLPELGLVGVHRAEVVRARRRRGCCRSSPPAAGRSPATSRTSLADLERLQEEVHPAGLDLGEVEDVVDEPEQVLAGRVDLLEVRDSASCAEVLGLLLEHLGVADDRVQRRPQLVGHVRQELRLVLAAPRRAARFASWSSSNSRAFSMAMTAWSANVSSRAISRSRERAHLAADDADRADRRAVARGAASTMLRSRSASLAASAVRVLGLDGQRRGSCTVDRLPRPGSPGPPTDRRSLTGADVVGPIAPGRVGIAEADGARAACVAFDACMVEPTAHRRAERPRSAMASSTSGDRSATRR